MKVRVIKPYTLEGRTYPVSDEILDVWDRDAVKGIRRGFLEDVSGRLKPVEIIMKKRTIKSKGDITNGN